ncbi:MAG: D-glucuronyl C5-epimerase family protein [Thermoleophilia bacterium]
MRSGSRRTGAAASRQTSASTPRSFAHGAPSLAAWLVVLAGAAVSVGGAAATLLMESSDAGAAVAASASPTEASAVEAPPGDAAPDTAGVVVAPPVPSPEVSQAPRPVERDGTPEREPTAEPATDGGSKPARPATPRRRATPPPAPAPRSPANASNGLPEEAAEDPEDSSVHESRLKPYVPPPTRRIAPGALPDSGPALAALRAAAGRATAGSAERTAIDWVLRLHRTYGAANAPAGRRATADLAVRVNAWWFQDNAAPRRPMIVRVPSGVLLTYRPRTGFVVNPVATTGRWRDLNDELSAVELADALLPFGVEVVLDGTPVRRWEYFDVPDRPEVMQAGVSGMGQARIASLMTNAFVDSGEERFAAAARDALAVLDIPVDQGGAKSMVPLEDGGRAPWYVERAYPGESPWKGAALNGFMVSLLSLKSISARMEGETAEAASESTTTAPAADSEAATQTARLAARLADAGADTLKRALPEHDLGDWTLYGIFTPGYRPRSYKADLNYQCYHVRLLRALAPRFPNMGFLLTAERWEGYVTRRNLSCDRPEG